MINSIKRRTIRGTAQRYARARAETKDAILWDIQPDQKICRVKVQDSNTLLECHYPENWKKAPSWLKVGNAVRIMHAGGNRRRFEVVGSGMTVPTQWKHAASTDTFSPSVTQGEDCVISGCRVLQLPDSQAMSVWVEPGVYRISGTHYTLQGYGLVMAETNTVDMSSGAPMDSTAGVVDIAAASATQFRMDAIVVGKDGVVDVVQGVASDNDPEIPGTPAEHMQLGWVFVPPGTTEITQDLINRAYVAPFASQMRVTVEDDDIGLDWTTATKDLTVEVLDQYGLVLQGAPWWIRGELQTGTGYWWTGGGDDVTLSIGESATSVVFTYHRENDYDIEVDPPEESCPVYIKFTLEQDQTITQQTVLLVLDIGGAAIL